MRTLVLSPCLYDKYYGGVQATAQMAWDAIARVKSDACLLCYGPHCFRKGRGTQTAMTCAHSKLRSVARALQMRGPIDVALVWHLNMLKLLPFVNAAKASVVLFLHGIESWKPMDSTTTSLLGRVDLFLTNSDFTWRRFLQDNPSFATASQLTVALGADEPDEHALEPADPPAAVILGRMCRQEDYKGHRQLIEVWPQVLRRLPRAELWVVGGGDLVPDLKELAARLSLKDHVKFWGLVSNEEKLDLLGRCRCLVLPSRGEGFGLVYLEAMRMGRPCLVSTLDAGREVVNPPEAGLAVDLEDPDALAEAVVRLVTAGSEWDEWSVCARRRYECNFTASAFQNRLLGALERFPLRRALSA